ncbi:hypothetical protein [Sandarakinorhabdus sp.]|uniref:hypothetical protein n=1 Tax=Sandarakinorhabdus sp. TaxID=1916663 RepID=UPI00286DCBD3|nr:hypothetical protein [Sandarakinorhabdus sp.]
MQRRRLVLVTILALSGALVLAWGLGAFERDIDAPTATAIADRLAGQYLVRSGESPRAFTARETRQWADGWEFRWRYRACPEMASLRVWISRNGRRANYAEFPDCAPRGGISAAPLKV